MDYKKNRRLTILPTFAVECNSPSSCWDSRNRLTELLRTVIISQVSAGLHELLSGSRFVAFVSLSIDTAVGCGHAILFRTITPDQ